MSNHVLERAEERGISLSIIDAILEDPQQIIADESGEIGQQVYQAIVSFEEKGDYLVRIFKTPPVIKSVYKTSKISKYYEGEI